jgi:CubicO group peptidase (beta-lactamase class C family)/glutamine amidotransferase-like uncharacterized protein
MIFLASVGCTNEMDSVGLFESVAPEAVGFSAEKLARIGEFCDQAGSAALLILHDGKVVYSWGNVNKKYPVHSIRKALLNGLIGIYVDRGIIDTNATLAELGIDDIPPQLTETEKQATIADLLGSRSGVYHPAASEAASMINYRPQRGSHSPGTHFYYNNWDFNVLGTIFETVTGEDIFEAFQKEVAVPLDMKHFTPSDGMYCLEEESVHPAYHFWMTAHDLALYGLLFLKNGNWNGKQIISEDWIETSTTFRSVQFEEIGLGYGWMWNVFSEDAGLGKAFLHAGAGIHMLLVLQDMNLVVIHRVDSEKKHSEITFTEDDLYQLFELIIQAASFPALRQRLISYDDPTEIHDDLSGIRVAIYFGDGMDRHSALAMGRAFQWMGCPVEAVNADNIRNDCLADFNVLACPGGESRPDPWRELGLEGKAKIQEFISGGGGYIGICLGALYASDYGDFWNNQIQVGADELYLDLFAGVAYCGQEEIAPQGGWPLMTWLNISDHTHPIADSLPERMKIVYYPSSPYLQPYDNAQVTIIATYEITENPAMVAFDYGNGRVFLSGPHPEIEVDSDRDGSGLFQELLDEGSEWPLLLEVMKWMTAR